MEIGQNDGGGDRREQWEYDIAHTHQSHLLLVKVHRNPGHNIKLKVNKLATMTTNGT